MKTLKGKICLALVYLCILLPLLLCLYIIPYKEILQCKNDSCTVERLYVFPKYRESANYYFNKTDDIQVVYHRSHTARGTSSYKVDNVSDYNFSIFENGFESKRTAENVLEQIKSNKNNIKITKYVFGCKIE